MGIQASQEEPQPFGAEDSQAIEDLEIAFKDSQAMDFDLEAVTEEAKPPVPPEEPQKIHGDSLKLDLEDLQLAEEPALSPEPGATEAAPEELLFAGEDFSEAGPENGLSPGDGDLSLEIGDLVIEDLPLEPGMTDEERDLDRFVDTTVVRPEVRVGTASTPSPVNEKPATTVPFPGAKPQGPPPGEVFFNLEDIKEDEIASIRLTPHPIVVERPESAPRDEEAVAAPEVSSHPPGRPAVSEELKLDWKEFRQDLEADGEDRGKR
jgi:hypothetical protein